MTSVPLGLSTLLALAALSAFTALTTLFLTGRRLGPAARFADIAFKGSEAVFLLNADRLIRANPAGRHLLGRRGKGGGDWEVLAAAMSAIAPASHEALDALRRHGRGFLLTGDDDGETVELSGTRHGSVLRVVLRRRRRSTGESDGGSELAILREIADVAPHLIWTETDAAKIGWSNAAYRQRGGQSNAGRPFPPERPPATEKGLRRRFEPATGQSEWFDEYRFPARSGGSIHFALPADPLVQAESALRNFVQALAQTFAHLPIGLAVFDRRRKLALFNPALAELTGLSPETLSAQPSLFAFLDLLRGMRTIPETRDFKAWREKIAMLERAAVDGTYEEDWDLPDGRTFRVTGRPHPDSAVAFLFEDITPSLSLQRRFRAELDLGQSVLDSRDEAMAVIAANGTLTLCNAAFAALWGFDPAERIEPMTIGEAVRAWSAACPDAVVWARLREYLSAGGARDAWQADLHLVSGVSVSARFSRLSQGATLTEFRHRETLPCTSGATRTLERATH